MALSRSLAVKEDLKNLETDLRSRGKAFCQDFCNLEQIVIDIDKNNIDPASKVEIIRLLNKCQQAGDSIKKRAIKLEDTLLQQLETLQIGDDSGERREFGAKIDSPFVASPVGDIVSQEGEEAINLIKGVPETGDDSMSRLHVPVEDHIQREPAGRDKGDNSDSGIVSTGSIPSCIETQLADHPPEPCGDPVTECQEVDSYNRLNTVDETVSVEDNTQQEESNLPSRASVAFAQGLAPDDQDFLKMQGQLTNDHRVQKGHRRSQSDSKISRDSSLDQ